jgi:hypothetical protein
VLIITIVWQHEILPTIGTNLALQDSDLNPVQQHGLTDIVGEAIKKVTNFF